MESLCKARRLRLFSAGEAAFCGVGGSVEEYPLKGAWFVENRYENLKARASAKKPRQQIPTRLCVELFELKYLTFEKWGGGGKPLLILI